MWSVLAGPVAQFVWISVHPTAGRATLITESRSSEKDAALHESKNSALKMNL